MSNQKEPDPHDPKAPAARRPVESHEDDVIVVPKGASKLRFLFLLGLTIFILVIFTVGDQLMSSVGSSPSNTDEVTWDGPVVGKRVYTAAEFTDAKRREDDYMRMVGAPRTQLLDEQLAGELLVDELAQRSGIAVSDQEVAKTIREGYPGVCIPFQTSDTYTRMLAARGVSRRIFEEVLRRKLRIQRYQTLLLGATRIADPTKIDDEWKKQNPQYAFDYVELEHAQFDAEAKAAQPDAAGMQEWYDAIPDKRAMFFLDFVPPSADAEVIAYRFGSEDTAAGLLAKYPLAAERDLEQLAKDYYNQYSSVRFVRETPLPEGLPESEGKDRLLNSYDEVSELAKVEAPIVEALRAWVADVKARKTAGETIDLAAEATALGLHHRPADGAKAEAGWSELEGIGGPFLARSIGGTRADDFGADVSIDRRAITFPRVIARTEAMPPAFEKVAEKAATEWLKQKTQELAVAKLNAIRDGFPKPEEGAASTNPKADEASFAAAAEAAGLVVQRRDWMSMLEQGSDPDASKPAHEFLRFNGTLRSLAADEVAPVQQDRMRTRSFLVRTLGQREPLEVKLTPRDIDGLQRTLASKRFEQFVEDNFSPKALAEQYKLRLRGSKEIPEPGV